MFHKMLSLVRLSVVYYGSEMNLITEKVHVKIFADGKEFANTFC